MVVGNGLIAKAFIPYYADEEDFLIFASGVSNSGNTSETEFAREAALLADAMAKHPSQTLVYFSTCSIYDHALGHTAYVNHKLAMEQLIQQQQASYYIFRISNLAGQTDNPHTFLNYFVQHIVSGSFFYLWKNAWRNVMDTTDMQRICSYIMQQGWYKNSIVNIANPHNYSVQDIIGSIERLLQQKGNYEAVDKTSIPEIDTAIVQQIAPLLGISFDNGYLDQLIQKYFAVK